MTCFGAHLVFSSSPPAWFRVPSWFLHPSLHFRRAHSGTLCEHGPQRVLGGTLSTLYTPLPRPSRLPFAGFSNMLFEQASLAHASLFAHVFESPLITRIGWRNRVQHQPAGKSLFHLFVAAHDFGGGARYILPCARFSRSFCTCGGA